MSLASQRLLITSIHLPESRTVNIFRLALLPVSRRWAHISRPVLFATYALKPRQSSTMASESLNSSESDQEHHQRRSNTQGQEGTPYAARAAAGAAAASSFFPLGYREGFSQWWARLPAAAAEHKVLTYLPYLHAQPPTHLQTGNTADFPNGSTPSSLKSADHNQEGEISTNSLNDPYGPRRWSSSMVELSGKDRALNEFSVERVGEDADQHLVMLHGYGAGLGFFYKNFEPLSRLKGWQLHALDMLGMGRSTRPPFKIKAKEREDAIREAEAWFVDALEEWRIKRKIDRFTLLGHSLGGYMAVAYALKYPGHLNKLILASPVGIPEDPYAVTADVPEPTESTLANELTQDQNEITSGAIPGTAPKTSDGSFITGRNPEPQAQNRPPRRNMPKWFAYLWDANISPFSLVRWTGPLGPRIVSGWTSRRFSHLPADEAKALHDYSYSIFSQRGSGEYALAYILAPGAFARSPLIRRIHGVGRQMIQADSSYSLPHPSTSINSSCSILGKSAAAASTPADAPSPHPIPSSDAPVPEQEPRRENGLPIVFMYGDHDWMDVSGGHNAAKRLEEEKERVLANATPEERRNDQGSAKVVVINRAGHHLYLDGWEDFNKVVLSEMEEVNQRERVSRT
ncbi:CCAAT-binding factor complex subunit HapC [Penicillium atrosanguineum]|uniref:Cardiolipin-specific deacylase n=1 Tax=Penicillium atrosanguineum TaxID=1132637 RepID=A0A9W9PVQ3_9EURO|nr:CCAAT-binding factor complex subunit HapC [Penicillium atrosanguineum]KAJ5121998.1 cardiolipin-specific deacylase [Penicillium atrosanguineum]KAJ5309642.1 CCAAT-binding factor complex subunit HapC [Penicillium atrosanguineum]KAJ5315165.1 cardiolipin-specific deacylase [Penicillium atrosanguineum]